MEKDGKIRGEIKWNYFRWNGELSLNLGGASSAVGKGLNTENGAMERLVNTDALNVVETSADDCCIAIVGERLDICSDSAFVASPRTPIKK